LDAFGIFLGFLLVAQLNAFEARDELLLLIFQG